MRGMRHRGVAAKAESIFENTEAKKIPRANPHKQQRMVKAISVKKHAAVF